MQLNHYTSKFKVKRFPITLVCDNVTNAPNIGSLFRTADAFGIEKLILCGENISLGRKMQKTSRASENSVNYKIATNALEVVAQLKSSGNVIIALEITENSEAIHHFNFDSKNPITIVIGDENFGISNDILNLVDATVHVEMFGQNSSMNVVQATTIALYELTKQFNS